MLSLSNHYLRFLIVYTTTVLSESYFSNPWGYFWTRLSIISAKIETVQRWWGKTYTRDWRKKRVGGTDTTKTLLRDSIVQHCTSWTADCQCYLVHYWCDIWYCIAISKTYCAKAYIQPPLKPNVNHCLVTWHVKYNTEKTGQNSRGCIALSFLLCICLCWGTLGTMVLQHISNPWTGALRRCIRNDTGDGLSSIPTFSSWYNLKFNQRHGGAL